MVKDGGDPVLNDTATVEITVNRNLETPECINDGQTVNIPFNEDLGTTVVVMNASDSDSQVIY